MGDPLRSAIAELDEADLANLLEAYKRLAAGAEHTTLYAFYQAVAAHLLAGQRRRASALGTMFAELADDGSAGEMVTGDLGEYIERQRANMREMYDGETPE